MLPSSWHAPGMVLCCTAATGLGMWSTSSTERACAARWLVCSTLIIITQRRWRTVCRTASTLCGPLLRTLKTGLATAAHSMVLAVPPSSSGCHPDAARTRNRYLQPKSTMFPSGPRIIEDVNGAKKRGLPRLFLILCCKNKKGDSTKTHSRRWT